MKQVVQDMRSGVTRVEEVPVPTPEPGMALVQTGASLVSAGTERMLIEFAGKSLIGKARQRPDLVRQTLDKVRREGVLSTLEAVQDRLDRPQALGYSSAGTIVAVGEGLQGFKVGDRVACAGGGYAVHAEYAVVPVNLMARLPATVDFDQGAFATLASISLNGLRLGEPQVGESVVVIGLGLLGMLAAQLARAAGCNVVGIDLDPRRVEQARSLGIEALARQGAEEAALPFSQGRGFDIALVCADTSSNDPVDLAGQLARDRGRVIVIGNVSLDAPRRTYYEKELSLRVSRAYGPGRYDPLYEEGGVDYPLGFVRWTEGRNLQAVIDLIASGRLDVRPIITHRFPIDRAGEAYELVAGGKGEPFLGVLLTYPEAPAVLAATRRIELVVRPARADAVVRLGVLGAGNFATAVMLPAVRGVPGISFEGIASAGGLKAAAAGRRFGFRYASSSEEEILKDPQINTVAVLTRHGEHARQVVAALHAGKHVFCEKPLALTREELEQVHQALEESRGLLTVGFNRRFAPLATRLKAFFADAGAPLALHYRVNAGALPADHWMYDPRQGGGRILGEACHFLDFLIWLTGALPVRVEARGLPDSGETREDNVVIGVEFADGSMGTVDYLSNGDRALAKERLEVFGGGRVAVLDDFRRLETYDRGRRQTVRSRLRQDKGHRAAWVAFARAVSAGGPPPIPYVQLTAATLATLAAVTALRTRSVVALDSIDLR